MSGQQPRKHTIENEQCIGGLRNPRLSIQKLPETAASKQVRSIIYYHLNKNKDLMNMCMDAIGNKNANLDPNNSVIQTIRKECMSALDMPAHNFQVLDKYVNTELNADMFFAWGSAARDPATELVTEWLVCGAPAGMAREVDDPGIFPSVDADECNGLDAASLETIFEDFSNHGDFEHNDDAAILMDDLTDVQHKKYTKVFNNIDEATEFLGEPPVLSPMACIVKEKVDNGAPKKKRRLILDCKASSVNNAIRRTHRIVLPRLTDTATDVLDLMLAETRDGNPCPGDNVEQMVLDFEDAFWRIPLHPLERKFFCAQYQGKVIIWLRTAQGSKKAPFTWAQTAAMAARLVQGMFLAHELRLQKFVDDPCVTARGTDLERDQHFSTVIIAWLLLGFHLAFSKGKRGSAIQWIGARMSISKTAFRVEASAEIMQDIYKISKDHVKKNVMPIKTLRTLTGKAAHVASIVRIWRPFVRDLWGALSSRPEDNSTRAPVNCIWVRQILPVLLWLIAFFENRTGSIFYEYHINDYSGKHEYMVELHLDASPWGLGAILVQGGKVITWMSVKLTSMDEFIFQHKIGESSGQQTWECLAVLVALRTWRHHWQNRRAYVQVKSDSVAALTLMLDLKSGGRGPTIVAREVALELAESSFQPVICQHVPGIANVWPDLLSRRHQPGKAFLLPRVLADTPETRAPERPAGYYRALAPPSAKGSVRHGRSQI